MLPADLPRLVAWLRSDRPAATDAQLAALFAATPPGRLRRLEAVLGDLAAGCGAPGPDDLGALAGLDDRLAGRG